MNIAHLPWPAAFSARLMRAADVEPLDARIAAIDAITDAMADAGYCRPREAVSPVALPHLVDMIRGAS